MRMRAFITGITGQDGAYLAQLLLSQGCEVYGGVRRTSTKNFWRLEELGIADRINFVEFELHEYANIESVIRDIRPNKFFNLAAQSFVGTSFKQPLMTADIDGMGVTRILESIRMLSPETCYYQASTSEMFGKVQQTPQTEKTSFYPRSPYGVAKLYAHWMTVNYREAYGLKAACGILFNHESPMRGYEFVTRKISAAFASIMHGDKAVLELGNLDAKRDWGHARDYVAGMAAIIDHTPSEDFLLATGRTHSVREFVTLAGQAAGIDLEFSGSGVAETARDRKTGAEVLRISPKFFRPAEVDLLVGDPTHAAEALGWKAKTTLEELVSEMVKADFDRLAKGQFLV